MRALPRHFLNWLYPQLCALCSAPAQQTLSLCAGCQADLAQNQSPCSICASPLPATALASMICGACLKTPPAFDHIYAPYLYQWPADKLIISLKFRGKLDTAALLAGLMISKFEKCNTISRPDCLIPVPLHKKRLRERGYNQATELARPLARFFTIPLINAAVRIRHTPAQSLLSLHDRERNVRGAFIIRPELLAKKTHIAIVDDVITSGSTVGELASCLRSAGIEKIQVWSFARTSAPVQTSKVNK